MIMRWRWLLVGALLLAAPQAEADRSKKAPVRAEATQPAAEAADEAAAPGDKAWWPATAKVGPGQVTLAEQAVLDLPADYVFFGKEDSRALMERLGNKPGEDDVGTILPKDIEHSKFFITVNWTAAGYVKDDGADKLDPRAILHSLREGNKAANEFRKEHGFPLVTVVGWDEPPRYERDTHQVVWAVIGKSDNGQTVNFNTRLLGRHGYLSMNLVCDPEQLAGLKPTMKGLLGKTLFKDKKRYADFKVGTDKVAEYGLAALVLGGAAVAGKAALKIGFLAKFGGYLALLFAKAGKAILLLFVAFGAYLKRLFGIKSKPAPAEPPTDTPV